MRKPPSNALAKRSACNRPWPANLYCTGYRACCGLGAVERTRGACRQSRTGLTALQIRLARNEQWPRTQETGGGSLSRIPVSGARTLRCGEEVHRK